MTETFLRAIAARGDQIDFIDRRFSKDVSEVGNLSLRKLLAVPSLLARASRAAAAKPKVCVLFATTRSGSFLVDLAISFIFRLRRRPVLLYLHARGFRQLAQRGRFWRRCVEALFAGDTSVMCLGPSLAADVVRWVPRERIYFLPNASTPPTPHGAESERGPVVLFMSNLIREKGALDFLELASRTPRSLNAVFRLAGASDDPGFMDELHAAIAAAGDAVEYVGAVRGAAKWRELARASVLIFPSTYELEAQPLTIIEAMSVGTPTIAYGTGGIPDLLANGSGVVVTAGDLEALSDRLNQLLVDPSFAADLSRAAQEKFQRSHSFDSYAERAHDIVHAVVQGPTR